MSLYVRIIIQQIIVTTATYFLILYCLKKFAKLNNSIKAIAIISLLLLMQVALFAIFELLFNPLGGILN
jgi:hypothetical protein